MNKPQQLRDYLTKLNPQLAHNPEQLLIFVDNGAISFNDGKSLAFEYQYTLNLIALDWRHNVNDLVVPILAWCYIHQPPKVTDNNDNFNINVDYLGGGASDIHLKLQLSERVLVDAKDNSFKVKYLDDTCPPLLAPAWINDFTPL